MEICLNQAYCFSNQATVPEVVDIQSSSDTDELLPIPDDYSHQELT
ncbi:hypothetical protein DCAR_0311699 [Daucus carota subsp. sativus]|uniref:Uncharacterized protein n=1 Tax=Daucus carota subsp. sativus TaxID=79200 RepID=A0A175YMB4_DAUCS|nr:hypothetical protein DCAR_0311699 [Daucus carota subsp. sativus]